MAHAPLPLLHRGFGETKRRDAWWLQPLVVFIILGVCYLGVLAFADSVRVRVGLGAIVLLHLIFVIAPPLL